LIGFVFFLPSGRLLELQCGLSHLNIISSGLGHPISGESRMGVSAEGIPTLKSAKGVFGTRRCTVMRTYLVLGIRVIYIILMDLPYWTGLVEWITPMSILPSF